MRVCLSFLFSKTFCLKWLFSNAAAQIAADPHESNFTVLFLSLYDIQTHEVDLTEKRLCYLIYKNQIIYAIKHLAAADGTAGSV